MYTEPADCVYIPLPRTIAIELAKLPEPQRGDLSVLARVLREYVAARQLDDLQHLTWLRKDKTDE